MMMIGSIGLGAAVAVFGIWAFLRGQRSMADIAAVGRPEGLHGPAGTLRRLFPQKSADANAPDYAAELRELFRDAPERRK